MLELIANDYTGWSRLGRGDTVQLVGDIGIGLCWPPTPDEIKRLDKNIINLRATEKDYKIMSPKVSARSKKLSDDSGYEFNNSSIKVTDYCVFTVLDKIQRKITLLNEDEKMRNISYHICTLLIYSFDDSMIWKCSRWNLHK